MIHSFSFKNFYSFRDGATVNFVVNKNAPWNDGYFIAPSGVRLSRMEVVIGPNASGKTNLMKVLPFLGWFITRSFNINPDSLLPFKPFAFRNNENDTEPTELSVVFEIDGTVYSYGVVLTRRRIISEELSMKALVDKKRSTRKVFTRTWDEEKKSYDYSGEKFGVQKGFEKLLRENASVISTAALLNSEESRNIVKYWSRMHGNVMEAGWVGDSLTTFDHKKFLETLALYGENDPLKKAAEDIISKFDIGVSSFEIQKDMVEDRVRVDGQAVHTVDGTDYTLNLNYESSGTKQLMVLLVNILMTLKNGSFAVIDELDVNLHPDVITELLDLFLYHEFLYDETDRKNAQILFSTQSHEILNSLDKYQITLVEKDEHGVSDTWRLDAVEGVRHEDNYYGRYAGGAYDAIPNIQ